MLTTLGFHATYCVERISDPVHAIEFRKSRLATAHDGIVMLTAANSLTLKVTPSDGDSWNGRFLGGAEGLNGVFATPNPDTLCVIVNGDGYWVPARDPAKLEQVRSVPIKRVVPILDRGVLIFLSYTRLAGYDSSGFMWSTDDLSWDGLEIVDVNSERVRGTAWDSPAARIVSFAVDVLTGRAEGGSSPKKYGIDGGIDRRESKGSDTIE